ncbi:MAG: hypothetical protein EAZ08_08655 [Cytophagales bacterium]|nr:MAG: hypothetical protein EAZ08_08655 [Cytophagales bacterium]
MKKFDFYTDIEFLQVFEAHGETLDKMSDEFDTWKTLYRLIRNDSFNLIWADTGQSFNKYELIRILEQSKKIPFKKGSNYLFKTDFDFQREIRNPFSIFFLNQTDTEKHTEQYGYVFANTKNYIEIFDKAKLEEDKKVFLVRKNEQNEILFRWNQVSKISRFGNQLLICEPYLTSWNKKEIELNLLAIIDNFIPQNYNGLIDVTIFCTKLPPSNNTNEETRPRTASEIWHLLQPHYRNRQIRLSLFCFDTYAIKGRNMQEGTQLAEILHGRFIFTNYLRCFCDHSFEFFKYEYDMNIRRTILNYKKTTIEFSSFLTDMTNDKRQRLQDYKELLQTFKRNYADCMQVFETHANHVLPLLR